MDLSDVEETEPLVLDLSDAEGADQDVPLARRDAVYENDKDAIQRRLAGVISGRAAFNAKRSISRFIEAQQASVSLTDQF